MAGVVGEHVENVQLFVERRLQKVSPFQHVDAACSADRAPTREGYRRVVFVTEVHQGGPLRRVHFDRGNVALGRLEEDESHDAKA